LIVDISAGGVGPRCGFTSVVRAAWVPVGADATKPPICGRTWATPHRSATHKKTPTTLFIYTEVFKFIHDKLTPALVELCLRAEADREDHRN
jgi:hypothetical protein